MTIVPEIMIMYLGQLVTLWNTVVHYEARILYTYTFMTLSTQDVFIFGMDSIYSNISTHLSCLCKFKDIPFLDGKIGALY